MVTLPDMPPSIEKLPRDDRNYPIPWFVAWQDGVPEFRAADGRKWRQAVMNGLCWVCGEILKPGIHTFVIGPMCAVNKTTSEPPCHRECAEFSAKACPFLSMPKAKRREANAPEGEIAGMAIMRNPGVTCLWTCRGFNLFDDGMGKQLIRLPNPSRVDWWAEGRKATKEEIMASINSGLPILSDMAAQEGPQATKALLESVDKALAFVH